MKACVGWGEAVCVQVGNSGFGPMRLVFTLGSFTYKLVPLDGPLSLSASASSLYSRDNNSNKVGCAHGALALCLAPWLLSQG